MEKVVFISMSEEELQSLIIGCVQTCLKYWTPQQANPEPEHEFLTLKEAASYLRLAEQTVYGLVHRKKIKHSHKGKRLYFKKSDLVDYISSGERKTKAEILAESESRFIELNKMKGREQEVLNDTLKKQLSKTPTSFNNFR